MSIKGYEDVQSMEDLYALIERDRIAAEVVAERVFQNEVNAAILAITEINAVASTRIEVAGEIRTGR